MKRRKDPSTMTETQRLMDLMKSLPKTYDGANVYVPLHFEWGTRKLSVKGKEFRNIISKKYYDTYEKFPSERALTQLVSYLLGEALERQSENPQYRIKHKDGVIYYDLCRQEGCVRISADGWEIVPEENGLFKQYAAQKAQVIPVRSKRGLDSLKDYINLLGNNWILFIVYLVSCFHPDIQHPILNVRGTKGTGKTTILEIVKSLVDPSTQKPLSLNHSLDSLCVLLSSCYYTIFDNLSKISQRQSDIFCKAVTGGAEAKRALYTDSDMVSLNFTSRVAFNGLSDVVRKDDLAQRTLFFKTNPMSKQDYITHQSLWQVFEQAKPEILGAIFDILASALKIYPTVQLKEYHRLGDFDKLGYAIAESIGEGLGEQFLEAVTRNEQAQLEAIYDGMPLVRILIEFMSDFPRWEGRMRKLYKHLLNCVHADMGDEYDEDDLPGSPAILGKQLPALYDVFESFGIDVEITRDKDNGSYVTLVNTRYVNETAPDNIIRIPIITRIPIISTKKAEKNGEREGKIV